MSEAKQFLTEEIRKPIYAFGNMTRWILKQSVLYVLRLILWSIFFMLPSLFLPLLFFHWFTAKMQEEIRPQNRRQAVISQAPVPPQRSFADLSVLHALSQDLRFWRNEILRFKR